MEENNSLDFILNLTKLNAKIYRKLDASLGGIGLNDYIILLNLSKSIDQKMRRIDLAEKVGLSASGVTRILLPMEKIGLISREINQFDARVSYVILTQGGKNKLEEATERINLILSDLISPKISKDLSKVNSLLLTLSKDF